MDLPERLAENSLDELAVLRRTTTPRSPRTARRSSCSWARAAGWVLGVLAGVALSACDEADASSDTDKTDPSNEETSRDAGQPDRSRLSGKELFNLPFPGAKNERSCATCHVPGENFTLTPSYVGRLLETAPNDPLFSAIDADDPEAETLTFEHLKKGLVRVWLTVPDNVDLIDDTGNVITPPERKMFVWRGVPSIADAALTAPYQRDGRMATLEEQAQGAVTGHSEGGNIPRSELERIAEYERTVFTSEAARNIADYLAEEGDPEDAPAVEDQLELTAAEERGRELYQAVCGACHGGANKATIVDREIHDLLFPVIKGDGTVLYEVPATDPPTPVLADQSGNEFLNVGTAVEMYLALIGATEHESYTKDVGFPNYRYRLYTDDSRTKVAADLPPAVSGFTFVPSGPGSDDSGAGPAAGGPGDGPGGPGEGANDAGAPGVDMAGADAGETDDSAPAAPGGGLGLEADSDGNPVIGPNNFPQFFSTDPGRAMITGSPHDFEAFDVPTLHGISKTAPYFHNNTVETLEEVVNLYSDHLLSRFPSLTQPGEKEVDEDGDIGAEETFTAAQKRDLVAFLRRL